MAKGDHKDNDIYLEKALYASRDSALGKFLPPLSVSLEEDGRDYVLMAEEEHQSAGGLELTHEEILRFPQNSDLAKNMRKAGAIARIHEIWTSWENSLIFEEDRRGAYVRMITADFQEMIDIADDFGLNLNEVLK